MCLSSFLLQKEMETIPGLPELFLYAHRSLAYGEGGKLEWREGGENSGWGRDQYVSL